MQVTGGAAVGVVSQGQDTLMGTTYTGPPIAPSTGMAMNNGMGSATEGLPESMAQQGGGVAGGMAGQQGGMAYGQQTGMAGGMMGQQSGVPANGVIMQGLPGQQPGAADPSQIYQQATSAAVPARLCGSLVAAAVLLVLLLLGCGHAQVST